MRQLRWIDGALVFLTALILLIAASGAAVASEPQVTLVPGQATTVVFDNPDNAPIVLTISSISAPDSLIPYLFISPTTISENSSREVTLQFVQIPQSIRENIPPDVYALSVSGGDSDLLVYLDISIPLPENAENRWAALEARIDALQASLTDQIEGLAARITALESVEQENWTPRIEDLRENLMTTIWYLRDWVKFEFETLTLPVPENSDTFEWELALYNLETKLREERRTDDAQVRQDYEEQIADSNEDAEYNTMMWSIGSALAVLGAVSGYFAIKKKFGDVSEKILKKTPKREPPKTKGISPEV